MRRTPEEALVEALVLAVESAGDPEDIRYEARIIHGLRLFGYELCAVSDSRGQIRGKTTPPVPDLSTK